jgi:alkylated DNA repair dioxygenase AlkB
MSHALSLRYDTPFHSIAAAYYRDGHDSVAPHGDKMGPLIDDVVIAILSLGGPRRFLLKPVEAGRSKAFSLGWGDLMVMGGTCQRNWLHGVPKVAFANPRVSVMFRPPIPKMQS